MALAVNFRLPPEDALKFFRGKGLVTSFSWQDLLHEEHDVAFTVAKLTDLDLLADVKDAVDRAITGNVSWQQFRDELEPLLKSRGWWGTVEATDKTTGEIATTVFDARRLRLIYDTNIRTAYATGHWAKIVKNAATAPYVMYVAVHDDRTRPEHAAWDGTVLRWDDAWWQTHTPPNGWNCRCSVIQLSARDLKKVGKDGPDTPPDDGSHQWTNPRTGEIVEVPNGIDPGWGYAPGKSRLAELLVRERDKLEAAPEDLSQGYLRGSLTGERFARWLKSPEGNMPVALLADKLAQALGAQVRVVLLSAETMLKQVKNHPELTQQDYAAIPTIVDQGLAIQEDATNIDFVYTLDRRRVVVVKATRSGDELYVVSLYRAEKEREVVRLRERGTVLREGE